MRESYSWESRLLVIARNQFDAMEIEYDNISNNMISANI